MVSFSESVSPRTATDPSNYQLTSDAGPLAVVGAQVVTDSTLSLQTAVQPARTDYTLTVSNVTTSLQPLTLSGLNGQLPVRVALPLVPVDEFQHWKYEASDANPSFFWRMTTFNDGSWPEGPAPIGYSLNPLPDPIRTPLEPDANRVTVYFRKQFDLPPALAGAGVRIRTLVDDGALFWLNGRYLFHLGMPGTIANSSDLATRIVDVAQWEGPFDRFDPSLAAGQNLLAIEVHQADPQDTDVVFGTQIEALILPSQMPLAAVPISFTRIQNSLILRWAEPGLALEHATLVTGPWTPLPDAQSPFSVQLTNQTGFYRLRGE
jgi:hypothetical protein